MYYFLNSRWNILPLANPLDGPFFKSLFGPLANEWILLKSDLFEPLAFTLFFSSKSHLDESFLLLQNI